MRRLAWIGVSILLMVLTGAIILDFMGLATVHDYGGQVRTAYLTNGTGSKQPMYQLRTGLFVTIPQLEGAIQIECRDGSTRQFGYVTPHISTAIDVPAGGSCNDAKDTPR